MSYYLARYTHRVAISNHRIVNFSDGKVTFRWKDYAHKAKQRIMTVTAEEFLRRFLLHTLPLALCAFASLASSQTGAVALYYLSAGNCGKLIRCCLQHLNPQSAASGGARSAAAQWP